MKTYQEFLNEETFEEKVKKFISLANSKCNPYLMAARGQYCYRGMDNKPDIIFKKKVRKDRRPLDMAPQVSKRLDDAFDAVFDIKARSQCLFVIGDKRSTHEYGTAYIIFPIGKIHWIWSNIIGDLLKKTYAKKYESLDQDDLEYWVKQYYTKDKNLDKAIKSGNEIMIDCKSYCAINAECYDYIKGKIR